MLYEIKSVENQDSLPLTGIKKVAVNRSTRIKIIKQLNYNDHLKA